MNCSIRFLDLAKNHIQKPEVFPPNYIQKFCTRDGLQMWEIICKCLFKQAPPLWKHRGEGGISDCHSHFQVLTLHCDHLPPSRSPWPGGWGHKGNHRPINPSPLTKGGGDLIKPPSRPTALCVCGSCFGIKLQKEGAGTPDPPPPD